MRVGREARKLFLARLAVVRMLKAFVHIARDVARSVHTSRDVAVIKSIVFNGGIHI